MSLLHVLSLISLKFLFAIVRALENLLCAEKGEGETYGGERHAEYSDESDICSDDDDSEVECLNF